MSFRWGPDSITSSGGIPLPNLRVTINVHGGGLASLYTDETGGTGAPNPTYTDSLGNLQFFAAAGDYDLVGNGDTITVTLAAAADDPARLIYSATAFV